MWGSLCVCVCVEREPEKESVRREPERKSQGGAESSFTMDYECTHIDFGPAMSISDRILNASSVFLGRSNTCTKEQSTCDRITRDRCKYQDWTGGQRCQWPSGAAFKPPPQLHSQDPGDTVAIRSGSSACQMAMKWTLSEMAGLGCCHTPLL